MNARRLLALACLLWLWSGPVQAQGFAGMASDATGFALPDPATRFEFPADHGPHPDFRIEWWYVTATLTGEDGRDYGLQWTLFRSALAPGTRDGWDSPQVWMGHAAVTTPDSHFHTERFARDGIGQAGVTPAPFAAWIDDWQMAGPSLSDVRLTATGADFAYDVTLKAEGPFVPQGENGHSVKAATGQASHYYSQPFYRVAGDLTLPGGTVRVTGKAWLDREWSSQPLAEEQTGWDWLSLHLDGGAKLMVYRIRDALRGPYTVATWIEPDGTPAPYPDGVAAMTPLERTTVAGRQVPTAWRVTLPGRGVDLEARAMNPQSWMGTVIPYWEGPVRLSGSHGGRGYLEMTGYD